jgi:hypothetical protein
VTPYRKITAKESGLYETCARHTARHTSRILQTGYFCDSCTKRLVHEALNDRPPVFHGQTFKGFCGLCNLKCDVTMRQWFACGPCWNVILAYQKSIAATEFLHKWWNDTIKPHFSHLNLVETEPVFLSPYARRTSTKKQSALSLSALDFLVSDTRASPAKSLFHIEQKTGPGSVEDMKTFQLDVNDFNDIVGAINYTHLPSYIVHIQAGRQYSFPTCRTVIRGMWYTDILRLKAHQLRIAVRRGEDKRAIYYDPAAFEPIEGFAKQLKAKHYKKLASKLAKSKLRLID